MLTELTELELIIHGQRCPQCHGSRIYRLQDQRYQCARCSLRINVRKWQRDVQVLRSSK